MLAKLIFSLLVIILDIWNIVLVERLLRRYKINYYKPKQFWEVNILNSIFVFTVIDLIQLVIFFLNLSYSESCSVVENMGKFVEILWLFVINRVLVYWSNKKDLIYELLKV